MQGIKIGLDVGSTTLKIAVLDSAGRLLFSDYQRHGSEIDIKTAELLREVRGRFPQVETARIAFSGSAGMGLAEQCGAPFVQEVHCTRIWTKRAYPEADTVIELGGEDAKILFLDGIPDARMNGSCAGGTGAFIDQMATLLHVTPEELNDLAAKKERIYTIASRCGVFAKSDIQPLLNQGAKKSDIAASILSAVVNQTVAGLAQGRPIRGMVLYLGGPLTFLGELRKSFDETLGLTGICPKHSLYYVALGAAAHASEPTTLDELISRVERHRPEGKFAARDPLFRSEEEYKYFSERHRQAGVKRGSLNENDGVFLGVDAGSTTVKFALIGGDGELLDSRYQSNNGNPVRMVREYLAHLYAEHPGVRILGSASTGYGEDLVRSAFSLDGGVVETVAHFLAARQMDPKVDFILDIGGQDIKCMKIRGGVIDNIYLNEACSSGCGSFLQTFASVLGTDIESFAKRGLFADRPVDLGSRCTVFMNSSVKQAQKDGATTENISAGLSISVVKNALYKVIRPNSLADLGRHIVVQGGTFCNDAVLRAFEQEIGTEVVRPDIAGLMGAYGAALYARDRFRAEPEREKSAILDSAALQNFRHETASAQCGLCENNCTLTINRFDGGRRCISGNRCERPATGAEEDQQFNFYQHKLGLLREYCGPSGGRPVVGLPMGLNMYELLPFWHAFFGELGWDVLVGPDSGRELYLSGQGTIPSDTVCYPAKLMHGHIRWLLEHGARKIFYPCMTYNIDENRGDNCFNCPVVAYYPEVIKANMPEIAAADFCYGYLGLHRRRDLARKLHPMMEGFLGPVTYPQVKRAVNAGYDSYRRHMEKVRADGAALLAEARAAGKPVVVLAGRPYHIDPGVHHGIDRLILGLGAAVISEDVIAPMTSGKADLDVLNQWTYHSRLYDSARYAAKQKDLHFVQLVSFGCGCDAITTDECRRILEDAGKIYTQIKIDEIENLGAVRIRLRSLFAALREKHGNYKLRSI